MNDLREWRFSDWLQLFAKAIPAFILVSLLATSPIYILMAAVWLLSEAR